MNAADMVAIAFKNGTLTGVTTCLVTGAAGFIGSHLTERLLELDFKVIGVDNLSLGRLSNLSDAFKNSRFNFIECDVNNYERMMACIGPSAAIDIVWHLAANSDIRIGDPEIELRNTFLTTFNVIKLMQSLSIYKLAFASSSAIYGTLADMVDEDSGPLQPISNYGAMKLASEAYISAAIENFLQRAWIFRFPNVVGSHATHGVIYDLIRKLKENPKELEVLGDGLQTKPYMHVSELVDAMLCIVSKGEDRLNCVNIAPATATSVANIVRLIVRNMKPVTIHYGDSSKGWSGDVPRYSYSIAKLKQFGCVPKMTSNEAVELAVNEMAAELA
jgi:UDP-glucose 4-epimerase